MSLPNDAPEFPLPPEKEPALRAPWPAAALAGSFLVLYALQWLAPGYGAVERFGFSPLDLEQGRALGLVTGLFVHGGWAHAFLNALGCLAFGAPVARLMGRGAAGAAAFLVFFLVCGVGSSLAYGLLHWGEPALLVGASGGVSGFMGAASRLLGREEGEGLAPFTGRTVLSMAGAWIVVNLAVAVTGLGGVTGGAPIAWEAHLVGYAIGLFLVGPAVWFMRRNPNP
jgi:membrane associated rhomboid family serine protease